MQALNLSALSPFLKFLTSTVFLSLLALILFTACTRKKTELAWKMEYPVIGSQSSPRTADLNEDGVLDIVMGAGKNEYQHSDQGIIALDGRSGQILWQQEAPDQVYGSATFYDVTGDGIQDVFIGGRSPHFKALDGKTGSVLWEYKYQYENDPVLKYARFNFNNSVIVPDQNNDGAPELLTVNGGNSKADPNSEVNRFPAVLILFDVRTGNIVAADTMPDGKESYMSPLCFAQPGSEEYTLIFGTGGETIDGHLYMARLSDLTERKLSNARIIASEKGHGFIAPPSVADITGDGLYDIVAISHGSTIFALDGKDQRVLWQLQVKDTESSNSFAVGYFTDDKIPDFFTFVSKGVWPNSAGSIQLLVDGKNGAIVYKDSLGCTGYSSPVVYDLNGDGRDEAIISINEYDCSLGFAGKSPTQIENKLIAIDFQKGAIQVIDQVGGLKNVFSTPWIGDMDGDHYLDIVYCQYYHYQDLVSFLGMTAKRVSTAIKVRRPPVWGAYMGSEGIGVFPIEKK